MIRRYLLALALLLPGAAAAQEQPLPKEEFRGAWIATVINLDWPSARGNSERQQQELVAMLDELKATGVNAVLFQVRSESDAMYASEYEPWSVYLTGTQGKAPDPFFDPLEFAIEEAHARGMELHAWFNPFRAQRQIGGYALDSTHILVERPEWGLQFNGAIELLNPGIPEVREYITEVIMDVVRRYDIDGVHFDDYFYPYPPNAITNEDQETYQTYNTAGFTNINTWRRFNINMFVRGIYEAIEAEKPEIKFGISPFGIWKNGVPSGIRGLDSYSVLHADPVNWYGQEWVDYMTPQLYWAFGGGQDYAKLATWWSEQTNGRHLYVGQGVYRAVGSNAGYSAGELPAQVRFNRWIPEIQGSILFRAKNLTNNQAKGFTDSLKVTYYRRPALTPSLAWHSQDAPAASEYLQYTWTGDGEVTLSWDAPAVNEPEVARYAVYRLNTDVADPDLQTAMMDAENLIGVTGSLEWVDYPESVSTPYVYFVTAVSGNSIESAPSPTVSLFGRAVSNENEVPEEGTMALLPNYPNPFAERTRIPFELSAPADVTLTVRDLLGRTVSVLANEMLPAGRHERELTTEGLAAGTYFYILETEGRLVTRKLQIVR
ncbi:MAG: family 10 glycosylhydrolase [Bacteroidota bacterium]